MDAYIIAALLLGLIPALIATAKGHNFFLWYLYGASLFLVAFIHSLCISNNTEKVVQQGSFGTKQMIDAYSPVLMRSYRLMQTNNDMTFTFTFINQLRENIQAIRVSVNGYDMFEKKIVDGADFVLQDLNVKKDEVGYVTKPYHLNNIDVRKLQIIVTQVCLSNGTIINVDKHFFAPEFEKIKIDSKYIRMVQARYHDSKYYPIVNTFFWMCSCGTLNGSDEQRCKRCSMSQSDNVQYINNQCLNNLLNVRNTK